MHLSNKPGEWSTYVPEIKWKAIPDSLQESCHPKHVSFSPSQAGTDLTYQEQEKKAKADLINIRDWKEKERKVKEVFMLFSIPVESIHSSV